MRMVEVTADKAFSLGRVSVVVFHNNELYIAQPGWNKLRAIDRETIGYEVCPARDPFWNWEKELPVKECRFYVEKRELEVPEWKKRLNKWLNKEGKGE